MKLEVLDVNAFQRYAPARLVREVNEVLGAMPLHVKLSDQANRKDRLIFSPVATNAHIAGALRARGWTEKVPFPEEFQALGLDGDLGKDGLLLEAQFSNYPFFLNNVVRTNVLYNAGVELVGLGRIRAAIIVTKAKLFEASNSTLYYEQAAKQLQFMVRGNSVQVPLRVIGLTVERGVAQPARLVEYHAKRYSRTLINSRDVMCCVGSRDLVRERERITVAQRRRAPPAK